MKQSLGKKLFAMPSPVWVVGTYDKLGEPDIMTASWGGICSSEPPCVGVSIKKSRKTYKNICQQKAFTLSIPSKVHILETDYIGLVSGRETNKFLAAKLTPIKSKLVNAPYVEEFPLVLECKLLTSVDLGSHTQFIGEIMDVKADQTVLNENGAPVMAKVSPLVSSAAERAYYSVGEYLEQGYNLGGKLKTK